MLPTRALCARSVWKGMRLVEHVHHLAQCMLTVSLQAHTSFRKSITAATPGTSPRFTSLQFSHCLRNYE